MFCGGHRLEKIPAPIEYRKAYFTKSAAYYTSFCDATASKRTDKKWLVSVVGAPEQKAVEILDIAGKIFQGKSVKLRWWKDEPPRYDCKGTSSGEWVGYDPERGCFDVPQIDSGYEVTLLYYSDGCDPLALLREIPRGDFMLYRPARMLVAVSDYVFDKKSCERVVCSEYSPLYDIKSSESCYYAPLPILALASFPEALFQEGGEMYTLGEINESLSSFKKKRWARRESCE